MNGSTLIGNIQSVNFTSSYTPGSTAIGQISSPGRAKTDTDFIYLTPYGLYTGPFSINGGASTGDATSTLEIDVYQWSLGSTPFNGPLVTSATGTPVSGIFTLAGGTELPTRITSITSAENIPASSVSTATKTISYTTPVESIGTNEPVVFKLTQGGMSSANYTASLVPGGTLTVGTIALGAGGYAFATTSSGYFIQDLENLDSNYATITLSSNLAQYGVGYQFIPYFVSASVTYSSSLYSKYGDVNTPFEPQYGDKIIMIDNGGIAQDLDVYSFSGNTITVVGDILNNWVSNPALVKTFLLLRKYNDEQNVILTYIKPNGATSYGFLLPNTVSPEVVDNINKLQANVQAQLLSTQANSNISNI